MVRRQSFPTLSPAMAARIVQAARESQGLLLGCGSAGECAGPQCLISQAPLRKGWLWATESAELQAWSLAPTGSWSFVHSLASLGCMV